jgi:hypothetical protein
LIWLTGHHNCKEGHTKNKVNQRVIKPAPSHYQAALSDQNTGSIPNSCIS